MPITLDLHRTANLGCVWVPVEQVVLPGQSQDGAFFEYTGREDPRIRPDNRS